MTNGHTIKCFENITGLEKTLFTSSRAECYENLGNILEGYFNKNQKDKILICSSSNINKNLVNPEIKIDFLPINNSAVAKSVFTKSTGAVLVELVQINDSIKVVEDDYLESLAALAKKNNALLIFDISTIAPSRLLKGFFNYNTSVTPDILIISKGIAEGMPLGALITKQEILQVANKNLKKGTNILAYKQALGFIQKYDKDLPKIISLTAEYIKQKLNKLVESHQGLIIESYGMLFTISNIKNATKNSAYDIAEECFQKNLILEALSLDTIKLSPPYIISKEEIDQFIYILDYLL